MPPANPGAVEPFPGRTVLPGNPGTPDPEEDLDTLIEQEAKRRGLPKPEIVRALRQELGLDEEEKPRVWTDEEIAAITEQVRDRVLDEATAETWKGLNEALKDDFRTAETGDIALSLRVAKLGDSMESLTTRLGGLLDGRTVRVDARDLATVYAPLLEVHENDHHGDHAPRAVNRRQTGAKIGSSKKDNGHDIDLSHAVLLPRVEPLWKKVGLWVGGAAALFGMFWLLDKLGVMPDGTPPEGGPETQPNA